MQQNLSNNFYLRWMADSQGGAVTDLEAKFKVLERCLVGGRFLLQEMDHMLRIANESSMLEFASVGDFCRLFKVLKEFFFFFFFFFNPPFSFLSGSVASSQREGHWRNVRQHAARVSD